MSAKRRLGATDSEVRAKLIAAAIEIVNREGCSALTVGRLAKVVGLTRPAVHYYFGTLEDIFIEILRHQTREVEARAQVAYRNTNPLREIWKFRRATSAVTSELIAMALRSERLREELVRSMETLKSIAVGALETYVEQQRIELPASPATIVTILTSVSYDVALRYELGIEIGQDETIAAIERWLDDIEKGLPTDERHDRG